MGSNSRVSSWIAVGSILAVEALKDQGFTRWNCPFRVLQQHAKSSLRSYTTQAQRLSGSSSAMASGKMREEKFEQSEESLRKVMYMYLTCWGPN